MKKCNWPIANGQQLEFDIYDKNTGWNAVPGLYVFSYQGQGNSWHALYIGQTDDFSSRFHNHERLQEAVNMGATHIHALVLRSQTDRNLYERLLIENIQPPMNSQHR